MTVTCRSNISRLPLRIPATLMSFLIMNKSVVPPLFLVFCRLLSCQGSGDAEMEHPIKVNASIASRFPFSVIGFFDNGCTGSLVGPCHVLTAGHCVLNPQEFEYANDLQFHLVPVRNGNFKYSFNGEEIKVTNRWQTLSDPAFDVAIVKVNDPRNQIIDEIRFLDFGDSTQSSMVNLNIAGYPLDAGSSDLWFDACEDVEFEGRSFIQHDCFVNNGSSGSPLWSLNKQEDVREILAIHTSVLVHNRDQIQPRPEAIILTGNLLGEIKHWIEELQCS